MTDYIQRIEAGLAISRGSTHGPALARRTRKQDGVPFPQGPCGVRNRVPRFTVNVFAAAQGRQFRFIRRDFMMHMLEIIVKSGAIDPSFLLKDGGGQRTEKASACARRAYGRVRIPHGAANPRQNPGPLRGQAWRPAFNRGHKKIQRILAGFRQTRLYSLPVQRFRRMQRRQMRGDIRRAQTPRGKPGKLQKRGNARTVFHRPRNYRVERLVVED